MGGLVPANLVEAHKRQKRRARSIAKYESLTSKMERATELQESFSAWAVGGITAVSLLVMTATMGATLDVLWKLSFVGIVLALTATSFHMGTGLLAGLFDWNANRGSDARIDSPQSARLVKLAAKGDLFALRFLNSEPTETGVEWEFKAVKAYLATEGFEGPEFDEARAVLTATLAEPPLTVEAQIAVYNHCENLLEDLENLKSEHEKIRLALAAEAQEQERELDCVEVERFDQLFSRITA